MPVYVEMVKDKKTGKLKEKKVDEKKQYYIRTYIIDEFGNKKQITRHNKEWLGLDGKNKAQQEENRLKNGETIKQSEYQNITISKLEKLYLKSIENKVDKDTLKAKEIKLNHFCQEDNTNQVQTYPYMYIKDLIKNMYREWQTQMRKKTYSPNKDSKKKIYYSIKYLNSIHNEICSMIDYGIVEGLCSMNIPKQVGKFGTTKEIKMSKVDKKYEVITYSEYRKLMEITKNDLKYNTLFDLAFTRGPRPGEIRAFRVCDYNYEKKQLMVNHTLSKKNELKDPKTASSKSTIDLDDEVNEKIYKLICYWKKFNNYNDQWFLFNGPTPISSHAIDSKKDTCLKQIGVDRHIRIHDFRHSCATWLFSIGININVICKILRHANIKETMKTYTHLLNDDYLNCINKLNKLRKQDQKQDQNAMI